MAHGKAETFSIKSSVEYDNEAALKACHTDSKTTEVIPIAEQVTLTIYRPLKLFQRRIKAITIPRYATVMIAAKKVVIALTILKGTSN
jgi:hypothetical protein